MDERKAAIFKFASAAAMALVAYFPTLQWMVDRFEAPESYYGHAYLIPLISGYIIWQRRDTLNKAPLSSEWYGLAIVVACLAAHLACAALRVYFVSGFTLVAVLYGLVLFFLGKETARILTFPLFFLFTMIPLPMVAIAQITVRLKLFATQAAALVLNIIGFICVTDGNVIRMPNSYVVVDTPCSGLRSLISLLTLGLLFTYFARISYPRKAILLLSSVPIAIATNIFRIVVVAILNDFFGPEVAMGTFHYVLGFFVFVFAFGAFLGVAKLLERRSG
ncbi:MAG: exosortase/archaeosortase family protein [Candidatus Omnitrophica bacterium]|nr:exosortase/archaeosortase family protein [Candidatus Omnitrophota bacterium]